MTTTRRRPLLLALAGGTAAVAGIGTAARTGLIGGGGDDGPRGGRLELSAGDMGVESLTLPLDDEVLVEGAPGTSPTPGAPTARRGTGKLATTTYSMVGFTWTRGATEPTLELSVRRGSAWEPWSRAPQSHESPDPGTGEVGSTVGSDLVWVGPTDGIRVRVVGERPADLALVLLHPTPLPGDEAALDDADDSEVLPLGRTSARAAAGVPRPNIRNRQAWGANEDLRDKPPSYISTIQQVHVHHTVNSNTYGEGEVPALIRGMYAYHTQSLGWSDLGYNFLVDRFGRVWTGRAGGASKNVRGAHTLGFNATSAGISVIGNFDQVKPPQAVIDAIARVAAWKLDQYGRDPLGRTTVRSEGSDKYGAGRSVTLPVIDGHRDTNDTSCPGSNLYAALPAIRQKTKKRIDNFRGQGSAVTITAPFTRSGKVVFGTKVEVRPGTWTPAGATPTYTWLRDGKPIGGARGSDYNIRRADIGSRITCRVDVAAEGAATASQTVSWPGRGRAATSLTVRAAGRKGRALITVVATAAGLAAGHPATEVVVRVAGRTQTFRLKDGRASGLVRDLPAGRHDVSAVVRSTATSTRATASDTTVVKPTG
ncbi:peptidoglycan recognition protein [Nocardioides sp. Arc9.136]|uniref:peptidoglycan recognition protein family protein n=1 Tax=Nocardioides sp. Arc9.136 TaxID=2996826 RepID=UPI002665DCCA|nr:peptidoglycan recognition protein [Nocardioides sp. Arc9.136]WKN47547.1 peptidoglycan recognition protein [Nocardioides sp. Arc9.136]